MLALLHRRRRTAAARDRQGLLDRRLLGGAPWTITVRRTASRSRTPTRSGGARCTTASSPAPRSPSGGPATPFALRPAGPAPAPRRRAATAARREPRAVSRSIFRPDPTIWDGSYANNGWLQELPKPLHEADLGHVGVDQPALAEERGLHNGDVIELKYRGRTAKMPVWIMPGHPQQSVTVFFGYGRTDGRARRQLPSSRRRQFNPYLLRTSDAPWFGEGLEIAQDRRALSAGDHPGTSRDGRARAGPRCHARGIHARIRRSSRTRSTPSRRRSTLYPDHVYDGYKWGMAIDLTSCTGCGACTIACVAENNIPVVGKEQVSKGREMHWIRVDHYFAGDPQAPGVDRVVPPAGPVHAVRERALRGGLPGRRDHAQQRRPERHGLQPLRRHALLLEQLPVQGAPLQLPALRRLVHDDARADAQPGRHGAQPRRHGEVHLLRAAHQPRADRRQEAKSARSATARSSPPARRPARPRRSCSATSTIRTAG